jgi:nitroreductase
MSLHVEEVAPSELRSEIMDSNLFSIIRNRRATRSYLAKPVAEEMILSLIDLAIQAPSAMNLQPWSFTIIRNSKVLKEISNEVKKRLFSNPNFSKVSREH